MPGVKESFDKCVAKIGVLGFEWYTPWDAFSDGWSACEDAAQQVAEADALCPSCGRPRSECFFAAEADRACACGHGKGLHYRGEGACRTCACGYYGPAAIR